MVKNRSYDEENPLDKDQQQRTYTIEGTEIDLTWRIFEPESIKPDQQLHSNEAVIFFGGWGYVPQATVLEPFCQELANTSKKRTFFIDTYTKSPAPHILVNEAKAVSQFITNSKIDNLIIGGSSQGGSQAIYLTELVQNTLNVNGLFLIDSTALYDQTIKEFIPNYIRENINSRIRPVYPKTDSGIMKERNKLYVKESMQELKRQRELYGNIHYYKHRLYNEELKEQLRLNPAAEKITVPIVIIHGADDLMTQAKKIIPDSSKKNTYIKDMDKRKQFLQKNLFTSSPSIEMIVVEKAGYHTLIALRQEEVARESINRLKRMNRPRTIEDKEIDNT